MNNIAIVTVSSMTTSTKFTNKKILIPAILGIGILISAIFLIFPVAYTTAQRQQQMVTNTNNTYMNAYSTTIPKINGSVNVGENIKTLLKENTKISFTAAAETAGKQVGNGTILGGHLGVTQGYLTYTYLIADPNKDTAYRVTIDAGNGKVLYTSQGQPISSFGHPPMFGPFGHRGARGFDGGFSHGSFGHFGTFGPLKAFGFGVGT
jgi:uncharacterized membrane protein YkoI